MKIYAAMRRLQPDLFVHIGDLLAAHARRAMAEFTPLRPHPVAHERVYRLARRGPLLDVFLLDMRSYRGPNTENRQPQLTDEARILGPAQSQWLKEGLLRSEATWKVIAADMPLGLVVVWITADVHYCATNLYDPPARSSRTSSRSTSSCRGRSTPAASAQPASIIPSAPRCCSRGIRAVASTRRRPRAGSASATCASTAAPA